MEYYEKKYYNRAVRLADITLDPRDDRLGFTDSGSGRAKGIELFIQKKFSI